MFLKKFDKSIDGQYFIIVDSIIIYCVLQTKWDITCSNRFTNVYFINDYNIVSLLIFQHFRTTLFMRYLYLFVNKILIYSSILIRIDFFQRKLIQLYFAQEEISFFIDFNFSRFFKIKTFLYKKNHHFISNSFRWYIHSFVNEINICSSILMRIDFFKRECIQLFGVKE